MHTRVLLRTLVAVGAAAALAVPGAAVAQTTTHRDASHDVQRYNVSTGAMSTLRHNRSVDVVRTRLTYGVKRLTSTVWLRSGQVGRNWFIKGVVRTGSTQFEWDASQSGASKTKILMNRTGAQVACAGLTLHVKHGKGRVSMSVPSSCLGKPDRLREGILFGTQPTDTVFDWDDALQKRGVGTDGELAMSHRLHRGR
jgi:hypothetical protein